MLPGAQILLNRAPGNTNTYRWIVLPPAHTHAQLRSDYVCRWFICESHTLKKGGVLPSSGAFGVGVS